MTIPVQAAPVLAATTALYRYFDDDDVLLYVGITDHLPVRERAHAKSAAWMQFAVRSTISRWPSRNEALAAERTAIETEHPIFNKQYNDTPEAHERLREYLGRHGMLHLLTAPTGEVSLGLDGQPWQPRSAHGPSTGKEGPPGEAQTRQWCPCNYRLDRSGVPGPCAQHDEEWLAGTPVSKMSPTHPDPDSGKPLAVVILLMACGHTRWQPAAQEAAGGHIMQFPCYACEEMMPVSGRVTAGAIVP